MRDSSISTGITTSLSDGPSVSLPHFEYVRGEESAMEHRGMILFVAVIASAAVSFACANKINTQESEGR